MALAQSCRLGVHVGYIVRVVASDPPGHKALASHLAPIMQRSSLYFAIGLRLLFVFPPFLLYLIGEPGLEALSLDLQGGKKCLRCSLVRGLNRVCTCTPPTPPTGPTTLLIATVIDLAAQLMFDVVEEPPVEPAEDEAAECDGALVTS